MPGTAPPPLRSGLEDFPQSGSGEAPFQLGDFYFDFFADDDEGDKDDKIIHARDTFTAESDVVNRHGELAADRQRRRTFNYLSHS